MKKKQKYPIGTKIRFLLNIDGNKGKTGVIVGLTHKRGPDIYLPTATKHIKYGSYPTLGDGTKITWHCSWSEIEILVRPNEQLVFDFMKEQ